MQSAPQFQLTLISSHNPQVVTKEFFLDEASQVQKQVTANVYDGVMQRIELSSPADFCSLLASLNSNQCLAYGVTGHREIKLITKKEWEAQGRPDDALPRTKESFFWPSQGGILMLDYDPPKDGSTALSREELTQILNQTIGLDSYSHVWWPSTSSCIFNGEEQINGIKGQRFYFFVKDGQDIERAAKNLNERLWAAGYGQYEISKSGSLLEKGLFDTAVWQPSRIDFAAGAKCEAPLLQNRGEPQIYEGWEADAIDTAQFFSSLTQEQALAAELNKKLAKEKKVTQADVIRKQWKLTRSVELKTRSPIMAQEHIDTIIEQAVERRQLMGDWRLTVFANGGDYQVTVAEVLANPDRYHGLSTLDPIEPDYDGRRATGKLFLKGARPRLHSFAHGGATYKLLGERLFIEVVAGKEHLAVDQLIEAFRLAPDVFEYGSEIVVVIEGGELMPLTEYALRYFAGGLVQFWKWKKDKNDELVQVIIDPPAPIIRSVLGLGALRNLKEISAVITAPTLRLDGTILDQAGYDEQTKILYEPTGVAWPIPQHPSQEQARQALDTLWLPFENFPFVESIDKAVLLVGLLTAAMRPSLPTAPAIGFDAPVQGSGKTLLAKCLGVISTGQEPAVWPHTASRDDEETRKRLFAAIRGGKSALIWDNVVGAFDSVSMAALLTSTVYTDRILSESKVSSIPNRILMLLTGNNLTLKGDMARRVLVARIDPDTERPFARSFDLDPYLYCLANRQKLISCALILIRFYMSSKVKPPGIGRTASFEDWDDMVRQTVIYLNQTIAPNEFGDVMDKMVANQLEDPEQESFGDLLCAWHQLFGSKAVTAAEVLQKLNTVEAFTDLDSLQHKFRQAIIELNPHFKNSPKSLGSVLRYRKGRIFEDMKLTSPGLHDGTILWRVDIVGAKAKVNICA